MIAAAGERLSVRLEAIDGNGLLPMRATDKVYARAHDFRRHLQRTMPEAIYVCPKQDPLRGADLPALDALPGAVTKRWKAATAEVLANPPLSDFDIDHSVGAVELVGGGDTGLHVSEVTGVTLVVGGRAVLATMGVEVTSGRGEILRRAVSSFVDVKPVRARLQPRELNLDAHGLSFGRKLHRPTHAAVGLYGGNGAGQRGRGVGVRCV